MATINCNTLQSVIGASAWDLSNEILYRMCREYPSHKRDDEIVAKIMLIGRVYSASVERRRQGGLKANKFYLTKVAPAIRKSKMDNWLDSIREFDRPTLENSAEIIAIHKKVTNLLNDITGMNKRSLASKYLHFHLPNLFFLYDSRASKCMAQIELKSIPCIDMKEYDPAYAKFFTRCLTFVEDVARDCQINLFPRQLDKYLLS